MVRAGGVLQHLASPLQFFPASIMPGRPGIPSRPGPFSVHQRRPIHAFGVQTLAPEFLDCQQGEQTAPARAFSGSVGVMFSQ